MSDEWALDKHIFVRVLVPLGLSMLLMGALSVSQVYSNIPAWTDTISNAMYTEYVQVLRTRCDNRAELTEEYFDRVSSDLLVFANYTTLLSLGELDTDNTYTSYWAVSSEDPNGDPPNVDADGISLDYSVFWSKYDGLSDVNADTSTVLDNVMRAVYIDNDVALSFYYGYEDTGAYRMYPFQRGESRPTFSSICASTGQTVIGYDPRCRSWYYESKMAALAPSEVLFTAPYSDASSGDTLITGTANVYDSLGDLLGVVGVDITMASLETSISGVTIEQNGYIYLLSDDNIVVSYPNLDRSESFTITELEFDSNSEADEFEDLLEELRAQALEDGQATELRNFTKAGVTWLTSVAVTTVGYTVVLVVPESDLHVVIDEMERDLISTVNTGTALGMVAVVVATIIGYFVVVKVTSSVTTPVKDVIDMLTQVTNDNLGVSMEDTHDATSSEIVHIYGGMSKLILALRFGNQSYYSGDMELALKNYRQVLEMMESTNNVKGMGVCYNNMGNAFQDLKQPAEARRYLDLAMENVETLLAKEKDEKVLKKLTILKAYRLMNLGMFLSSVNDRNGVEMLTNAMNLHRSVDNVDGIVKATGNLVQVALQRGELQEAYKHAYNVLDKVRNREEKNPIQYASMNMGDVLVAQGQDQQAAQYYRYALDCAATIPQKVKHNCITRLADIYARQGDFGSSKRIMAYLQKPRCVYFVLDVSGSMWGPSIDTCKNSMKVITGNLSDSDRVSLFTFNNHVKEVFPLVDLATHRQYVSQQIDSLDANYGTAFYDAIVQCAANVEQQAEVIGSSTVMLVALTDGDDGNSRSSAEDAHRAIKRASQGGNLKFVMITVDTANLGNLPKIKHIVEANPDGIHLAATDDPRSVTEAFKQVSKMLASNLNVESF